MAFAVLDIEKFGYHYNLVLERRINFVRGGSDVDKTRLFSFLTSMDSDILKKHLSGKVTEVEVSSLEQFSCLGTSGILFVLDAPVYRNPREFSVLLNSICIEQNIVLLVITRDAGSHVDMDEGDLFCVYDLKSNGQELYLGQEEY